MARTPAPGTRERILDTATRLFREHGVRAVGMQQIVDESGTGKNLLYREFASKDDLVEAYIDRFRGEWAALVAERVDPLAGDPSAQLVALARIAAGQAVQDGQLGCVFRNCYREFPDPGHRGGKAAAQHLQTMRRQVLSLARKTGAADPELLGEQVWVVLEGMYAAASHPGGRKAAATGFAMIEKLVAEA